MIKWIRSVIKTASSGTGRTINRRPSVVLAGATPWVSIMLASVVSGHLWIASAPIIPPFGLMLLIAWRQIQPGSIPVWAGFPLGMMDDLISGQPFGSAILLWSLAMIALEIIESRMPGRGIITDWLFASVLLTLYLFLSAIIAILSSSLMNIVTIVPQITMTILAYPVIVRFAALLDRLRLTRFLETTT